MIALAWPIVAFLLGSAALWIYWSKMPKGDVEALYLRLAELDSWQREHKAAHERIISPEGSEKIVQRANQLSADMLALKNEWSKMRTLAGWRDFSSATKAKPAAGE